MTVVQAFAGGLIDQWSEIVTADGFDEHTVVSPGVFRGNWAGEGGLGEVVDGSQIYVPENTAAFVFSGNGVEAIMGIPGGYVYHTGPPLQQGESLGTTLGRVAQMAMQRRVRSDLRTVAFINLREIRGLKWGTPRPVLFHDNAYGTDLEITAFGTYSLRVVDPITFVQQFIPANTHSYTFADPESRQTLASELLQSFAVAVNSLSASYRISELPSRTNEVVAAMMSPDGVAASWLYRFGMQLSSVAVESLEFSPSSRRLVEEYSRRRMHKAADASGATYEAAVTFQQQVVDGIRNVGFAGVSKMLGGQGRDAGAEGAVEGAGKKSVGDQSIMLRGLRRQRDRGTLTAAEYEARKREILGD
ncbi:SPFH domain-containing protein [Actinomyces minihominis]|uniref:SPFH domain-containing protein n=1 Tax=Actinomyces minihominis TaxID=2002838 RepID=UPI000C07C71D|nr:SPFH domain-containing protein [Actinomyces minihominis]